MGRRSHSLYYDAVKEMKECTGCHEIKHFSEFPMCGVKNGKQLIRSNCGKCHSAFTTYARQEKRIAAGTHVQCEEDDCYCVYKKTSKRGCTFHPKGNGFLL